MHTHTFSKWGVYLSQGASVIHALKIWLLNAQRGSPEGQSDHSIIVISFSSSKISWYQGISLSWSMNQIAEAFGRRLYLPTFANSMKWWLWWCWRWWWCWWWWGWWCSKCLMKQMADVPASRLGPICSHLNPVHTYILHTCIHTFGSKCLPIPCFKGSFALF